MRGGAASARVIRAAFGRWREAEMIARDPDEARRAQTLARTRAAAARARIARELRLLERSA